MTSAESVLSRKPSSDEFTDRYQRAWPAAMPQRFRGTGPGTGASETVGREIGEGGGRGVRRRVVLLVGDRGRAPAGRDVGPSGERQPPVNPPVLRRPTSSSPRATRTHGDRIADERTHQCPGRHPITARRVVTPQDLVHLTVNWVAWSNAATGTGPGQGGSDAVHCCTRCRDRVPWCRPVRPASAPSIRAESG